MIKAIILAMLLPTALFAAEQTISFNVKGNCKSCEKKIVRAAERVDGVEDADWDKKTKVFTATFDDEQTNKAAIAQAILNAGYDVEDQTASNKAYKKLPKCCKYRDGVCED